MAHEIRLVGFDARPFALGKPTPFARRRLEAAKREINRSRKVALPIVGGKSLVRLANEASRQEELGEEDRKRICNSVAQYAETEAHRQIPLTRVTQLLARTSTLKQFNEAVLAGHFGDLAALHAHAEENNTQIVPLESTRTLQQIRTPKSERETSQAPARLNRRMTRNKEIRGEARKVFKALGGIEPEKRLEPEEKRLREAAREVAGKKPETVIADAPIYRHLSRHPQVKPSRRRVIAAPLRRTRFGI